MGFAAFGLIEFRSGTDGAWGEALEERTPPRM
jgi:hypothetical protein